MKISPETPDGAAKKAKATKPEAMRCMSRLIMGTVDRCILAATMPTVM
jgi:hypothetical protein